MKLNKTDNPINREGRNKLNENWETLERTYKKVVDDSSEAKTTAFEAKEIAQGIDGKATEAVNIAKQKGDESINIATQKGNEAVNIANQANNTSNYVQNQLDTVILESGDANPEVVQARAEFVNLRDRLDTEFGQVTTQLAQTASKEDVNRIDSDLIRVSQLPTQTALIEKLRGVRNVKIKLPFPDGFTWTDAPINIYKSIDGEITTDFDVSKYQHIGTGKTYYVNVNTGHNANNDGLSEATPLKSLWAAIQKPDVDIVILADGHYSRGHSFAGFKLEKNISIKAKNKGMVTFSNSDDLTWTKTENYSNVYQATRSASVAVYDKSILDGYGDYDKYSLVTSISDVDAMQGSYFIDESTVYVHTRDSRPADNDIRVMMSTVSLTVTGNCETLYLEGVNIEGGSECLKVELLSSPTVTSFYFNECKFKYASGGNVLRLWGLGKVFSQKCEVAHGKLDGFNYHVENGALPDVIEVDCIGRHNGLNEEGDSNNGSTMHDGGRIIRVNGDYHHNKGPNVVDVNEGGQSWCVGTLAHESVATKGSISNSDFKNGNLGKSKMWLDSCVSYGSDYSHVVADDSTKGAATYLNNVLFLSNMLAANDGGTIEQYDN